MKAFQSFLRLLWICSFFLVTIAGTASSNADTPCQQLMVEPKRVDETAPFDDFRFFKRAAFKKILLLGDGGKSLGHSIAANYPEKNVVRGDICIRETAQIMPNFIDMHIDNTQALPFAENSFDAVILRRGLCLCRNDTVSCGGILATPAAAFSFFAEVTRVLNKNNPKALALLHGVGRNPPEAVATWKAGAEMLLEKHPNLLIHLEQWVHPPGKIDQFNGVRITPTSTKY